MSQCFDHKTAFPDSHSEIPPDSNISASNAIVYLKQASCQKDQLEKQMLGFTAYALPVFSFECMITITTTTIYIFVRKNIFRNSSTMIPETTSKTFPGINILKWTPNLIANAQNIRNTFLDIHFPNFSKIPFFES